MKAAQPYISLLLNNNIAIVGKPTGAPTWCT